MKEPLGSTITSMKSASEVEATQHIISANNIRHVQGPNNDLENIKISINQIKIFHNFVTIRPFLKINHISLTSFNHYFIEDQ